MARFVYRMESLLEQKQQLKKDAEAAFGERQKELRRAQSRLEELTTRETEAKTKKQNFRLRLLAGGGDGRDINNRVENLRLLEQQESDARNDVFSQQVAIEECEQRLQTARQEMADRSREVEVLTKHREHAEQEFWGEVNRKDALEQDEIGATLYEARRRRVQ